MAKDCPTTMPAQVFALKEGLLVSRRFTLQIGGE